MKWMLQAEFVWIFEACEKTFFSIKYHFCLILFTYTHAQLLNLRFALRKICTFFLFDSWPLSPNSQRTFGAICRLGPAQWLFLGSEWTHNPLRTFLWKVCTSDIISFYRLCIFWKSVHNMFCVSECISRFDSKSSRTTCSNLC